MRRPARDALLRRQLHRLGLPRRSRGNELSDENSDNVDDKVVVGRALQGGILVVTEAHELSERGVRGGPR